MQDQSPLARLDAVIVSYNSRETLRDCVVSLCATGETAVIVVDNDSADDGPVTVADLPVRVIHSGRNGGFAFGCNLGTAAGSSPYVLLLNPDARLAPGAAARLADVLDREPQMALVAPRILDENGDLHLSQRHFPRLLSTWSEAVFLHRLLPRAAWTHEVIRDRAAYARSGTPDWVSGASMLVRRSALEAVGGLDEDFFLYCEDTDLCRRLRNAGWEVAFEPGAVAHHAGGHSAPRASTRAILARSRVIYARKHAGRTHAALERLGIAVSEAMHALAALRRPARARGHVAALRAMLRPAPREA